MCAGALTVKKQRSLPQPPFEGLQMGRAVSQCSSVTVSQGFYCGSAVVVRVRP